MSQSDTFSSEDFDYIKNKIFALAGIHYTEKKWDLVESRVQSLFRKSEIKSMSDLKNQLEAKNSKTLQTFINLLTTNKTDFFREPRHFDYLIRELIPIWTREEKKEVNVWSCASSTGEEPYTVAMILKKHLPENIRWNVFASDIDTDVLQFAKNGVYLNQNLKEIPEQ